MLHTRRLLIAIAIALPCAGETPTFYPAAGESTLVSFDVFGYQQAYFTCRLAGGLLHVDSVSWSIDGTPIDTSDARVRHTPAVDRTGPYDPALYATGTRLEIKEGASRVKFADRYHRVDLEARYTDTVVVAHWFFRHFETQYRLVRALVSVDSVFSGRVDGQWRNYRGLSLCRAEELDTSIFLYPFRGREDVSVRVDTAGLRWENVSTQQTQLRQGDTVDCILFQTIRHEPRYDAWVLSEPVDSFVTLDGSPFALRQALVAFNEYLALHDLPRGYSPPPGDLLLGPIFGRTLNTDLGWSVSARHDGTSWYITHGVGSGDCPSGCLTWHTYVYGVSADGDVVEVARTCSGDGCDSRVVVPMRHRSPAAGMQHVYTLRGRYLGQAGPARRAEGAYLPHAGSSGKSTIVKLR